MRSILRLRNNNSSCFNFPRSYFSTIPPNSKTVVIINDIGNKSTFETLKSLFKDLNCRRFNIQPGCVLHFSSEVEAEYIVKKIKKDFNLDSRILPTSIPSVLLTNIPDTFPLKSLSEKFNAYAPKKIAQYGSFVLHYNFPSPQDALKASKIVSSISYEDNYINSTTLKSPNGKYSLLVNGLPSSTDPSIVLKPLYDLFPGISAQKLNEEEKGVDLRISPIFGCDKNSLVKDLEAFVHSSTTEKEKLTLTSQTLKKPALFIRKIAHAPPGALSKLVNSLDGVEKIQELTYKTDLHPADMAVVYFQSEEAALKALATLKTTLIKGKKMSISYKQTSAPAVLLSNLPQGINEDNIKNLLFENFILSVSNIRIIKQPNEVKAIVQLEHPKDAERTCMAFQKSVSLGGKSKEKIKAQIYNEDDIGISIRSKTLTDDTLIELKSKLINELKNKTEIQSFSESKLPTNKFATLTFVSQEKAALAHSDFITGKISFDKDTTVNSKMIQMPSYTVEVEGLASDKPSSQIIDSIDADDLVNLIGTSRSAMIKFRRHSDVLPGIRKLRTFKIDGKTIKPVRYNPLDSTPDEEEEGGGEGEGGGSEFDNDKNQFDVKFDKLALHMVTDDFLAADPATRYQIAKNQFERLFHDAKRDNSVRHLLDDNAPVKIKEEVLKLINDPIWVEYDDMKEDIHKMKDDLDNISQAKEMGLDTPKDIREEHSISVRLLGRESDLVKLSKKRSVVFDRLFDLFTQRKDMLKFSHDFDQMRSLFGPENPNDPFDWSEFRIEDVEDVKRLEAAMRQEELRAAEGAGMSVKGGIFQKSIEKANLKFASESDDFLNESSLDESQSLDEFPDEDSDDISADFQIQDPKKYGLGSSVVVRNDSTGVDEIIELEKGMLNDLTDEDGHQWSGVIIHTDNVQKVMPKNRVASNRALVVIGNLRGAAGFGTFSAHESINDAINGAFRDALNNLVFIDLYDNFGLAHDVYGKHNGCHAYIRATPRSRLMTASSLATSIFNRFGISSVSCKLVGRRNPYSMVRAIFNALEKHENIDEFAKARGQRYLTLRWAYDKNI